MAWLHWRVRAGQVLERGERIDLLVDKTEDLQAEVPRTVLFTEHDTHARSR